jgi:hypothetical protein
MMNSNKPKEELNDSHPNAECPKCGHWNTLHVRNLQLPMRDFLCCVEDCGCIQRKPWTAKDIRDQVVGCFIFLLIMCIVAVIVGGSVSYFFQVHVPALRHLWR